MSAYVCASGRGPCSCAQYGRAHDVKPANIFLEDSSFDRGLSRTSNAPTGQFSSKSRKFVRLVDFGIAKLNNDSSEEISQALTQAGFVFGSPLYMSPEQVEGAVVDHRSDIYSFGCTLFEALTGSPPFVGENALETMVCHQYSKPPTLYDAGFEREVPQRLHNLLARLLAKNPEERYQSLTEVAAELNYCFEAIVSKSLVVDSGKEDLTTAAAGRRESLEQEPAEAARDLHDHASMLPQFSPRSFALIALIILLIAGGGIFFYERSRDTVPSAASLPSPTYVSQAMRPTDNVAREVVEDHTFQRAIGCGRSGRG